MYKIRNKKTGLFMQDFFNAIGETKINWSKTGHLFTNQSALSSHLNRIEYIHCYDNCEVVEYDLVEKCADSHPSVTDFEAARIARIQERENKQQSRENKRKEKEDREIYENLKKKFEGK